MKNSGTWIDWQYLLKAAELLMKVYITCVIYMTVKSLIFAYLSCGLSVQEILILLCKTRF